MELDPSDLAIFGVEDADPFADLASEPAPAAVKPPDAPKNDPNATVEPKRRGRPKKVIVDVAAGETEGEATARHKLEQGEPYKLPSGQVGEFTCVTNGDAVSFKTPTGVELVPVKVAAMIPEHRIVELGPKTLAALAAMLGGRNGD